MARKLSKRLQIVLSAALATACAAHAPPRSAAPEPVPALKVEGVRPIRYALDLTVSPSAEAFEGQVEMEFSVDRPRRVLWVNASELSIHSATLRLKDGIDRPARVVPGDGSFVGFALEEGQLPTGTAILTVHYRGQISSKSSDGLFREEDHGAWYLYSQFEPQFARRAFPCLDQPEFKTPWTLTLHVPEGLVAVANTPVAREERDGTGMKAVTFLPTRPLPSYLVAFGVGPFDRVDLRSAGRNRTPMHIYLPRGHLGQTALAEDAAPRLLELLERYFNIAYPYEKLDLLVIPVAVNFGAMENPGLITFIDRALLAGKDERSFERDSDAANNLAHELSHQWFGDLVTTAWWDDIWLNEAFANWLTLKVLAEYRPDWPVLAMRTKERERAFGMDQLTTARRIREPITHRANVDDIFDPITYEKGAAVIGMFERWVGPAVFQAGVRRYMRRYAFRAATADDFLAAISEQAGRDVAQPFRTFLDQPGLPLVTAHLECGAGAASLHLTQERFRPLGSRARAAERWQIPICARYGAHGEARTACTLLADGAQDLVLTGLLGCPEWVWPDADATGARPQGRLRPAPGGGPGARRASPQAPGARRPTGSRPRAHRHCAQAGPGLPRPHRGAG